MYNPINQCHQSLKSYQHLRNNCRSYMFNVAMTFVEEENVETRRKRA